MTLVSHLFIFVNRIVIPTDSISKYFSIRSQKIAESLLEDLVSSDNKSKWVSRNSQNKPMFMKLISNLFAK